MVEIVISRSPTWWERLPEGSCLSTPRGSGSRFRVQGVGPGVRGSRTGRQVLLHRHSRLLNVMLRVRCGLDGALCFDGHSSSFGGSQGHRERVPQEHKGMRPWPSGSAAASRHLVRFSCWFQQDFLGVWKGSGEGTY